MDTMMDVQTIAPREISLAQLVKREVALYAGISPDYVAYAILDDVQQHYIVVDVAKNHNIEPGGIIVMARVVDDYVMIEEDTTDKPLYKALIVNANIPREQIILAYEGETLSER
jgi:hypothetical protein